MFCQNCGTRIKDGEARCPKCGMRTGAGTFSETLPPNDGYGSAPLESDAPYSSDQSSESGQPTQSGQPYTQTQPGQYTSSGQPRLSREQIIGLFRAASMEPGQFYAAGEIPAGRLKYVTERMAGIGVGEDDILGVYFASRSDDSVYGYVLTEQALYNMDSFMKGRRTGSGCVAIPFNRISRIVITNKYVVGVDDDMNDEFWDMQLYVDGKAATSLYYWKANASHRSAHKERYPIRLREYAIAVNEMVKAVQGRPVIELRLDNPADAARVKIPEQDRMVVATSAGRLLGRFLLLGIPAVALAQFFIFWMLWGHDWSASFWPIVTLVAALGLMLFAGSTFISLLGRGGKFMRGLARILYLPLMAAVCAIPAYLSWNLLGFAGRYASDGASAESSSPGGMVYLEAASYTRGLDRDSKVYNMFMAPSHRVTFTRGFSISDHEVTQGEFKAVMGKLPKCVKGYYGKGDDCPVYGVNWYMALAYCNKRSLLEGLEPCYSVKGVDDWAGLAYRDVPEKADSKWDAVTCDFAKNGYRLPTEAEWEYAARAGDDTGDAELWSGTASVNSLRDYAWYSGGGNGKAHTVRTKQPNAYGLYDMTGNVWEWCWDRWGAKIYEDCTDGVIDPQGPDTGDKRVKRGGGWNTSAENCQAYDRYSEKPQFAYGTFGSEFRNAMGFRVVRTAP